MEQIRLSLDADNCITDLSSGWNKHPLASAGWLEPSEALEGNQFWDFIEDMPTAAAFRLAFYTCRSLNRCCVFELTLSNPFPTVDCIVCIIPEMHEALSIYHDFDDMDTKSKESSEQTEACDAFVLPRYRLSRAALTPFTNGLINMIELAG